MINRTGCVICFCVGVLSLAVSPSSADVYRFVGRSAGGNQSWLDGRNWRNQTTGEDGRSFPGGIELPGADDTVRYNFQGESGVLDADAGIVKQLQVGVDGGGGSLTFKDGAKLLVFSANSVVGGDAPGSLIVNGGRLSFGGFFKVESNQEAVFEINGGTVRVDSIFYHCRDGRCDVAHSTVRGGLLDVNAMILNSGVLDIAGGVVRIRTTSKEEIRGWASTGLMTFNGLAGGFENIHYVLKPWGDNGFEIIAVKDPVVFG